jgi:hypothetical protein
MAQRHMRVAACPHACSSLRLTPTAPQVKKWQALNNKRYAEKRKYGYTQVSTAHHSTTQHAMAHHSSEHGAEAAA